MTNSIILQGTTPLELAELINEGLKNQLEDFKKNFTSTDPDELLTRTEACELLKINSSTLWHWTKKGKLTCLGIGNRRYYKKSEIMESLILKK